MDHNAARIFSAGLGDGEFSKNVVVLGSGPDAPSLPRYVAAHTNIVAINNAWRAVPEVDISIYPNDFPSELRHPKSGRIGRSCGQYLPSMETFGGLALCGATMVLATGYWAIANYPYSQVSYFACDMIYSGTTTHFYGNGQPDPLRRDITLQNLSSKQLRLFYFGLLHKILFLNASSAPETRLVLPRVRDHASLRRSAVLELLEPIDDLVHTLGAAANEAIWLEANLNPDYRRPDYWHYMEDSSAWAAFHEIDDAWLALDGAVSNFALTVQEFFSKR